MLKLNRVTYNYIKNNNVSYNPDGCGSFCLGQTGIYPLTLYTHSLETPFKFPEPSSAAWVMGLFHPWLRGCGTPSLTT